MGVKLSEGQMLIINNNRYSSLVIAISILAYAAVHVYLFLHPVLAQQ